MPPKATKEALTFLINIGVRSHGTESDSKVLEKAKYIVRRLIEQKIFFRPKDEIGIILMGSTITKNKLDIEHVEELMDLQVPNWEQIEKVLSLKNTHCCSNWIEALYATLEYIKKNVVDASVKKLVLLSVFNENSDIVCQFQADQIAKALKAQGVQLLTIGEHSFEECSNNALSSSEVLLKAVHKQINGQHITYDSAMSELRFYKEVPVRPLPWYCTLELIDIQIPIAYYVKVTDVKRLPSWSMAKEDQKVKRETQYLDRQRCTYSKDQAVKGYKYGGEFTPVADESEQAMEYKSGEKSYKIHSFTSRDNVGLEYWCSGVTGVVVPSTQLAERPFYSLIQAMEERNLVALVRKVYRNNSTPVMVALFPCTDIPDEPRCLVEIQLPFAEDRRVMDTKPIKSVLKQLSKEQNDAVDQLLDSFCLDEEEDSSIVEERQSFLPGCIPNPTVQQTWNMLSHRAVNPDKPLPPMEEHLKEIFEIPSVKKRSKPHLDKIATLFQLEIVNPKKEKAKAKNKDISQVTDSSNTVDPQPSKSQDKLQTTVHDDNQKDSVLSSDTSDIDMDDLAANI